MISIDRYTALGIACACVAFTVVIVVSLCATPEDDWVVVSQKGEWSDSSGVEATFKPNEEAMSPDASDARVELFIGESRPPNLSPVGLFTTWDTNDREYGGAGTEFHFVGDDGKSAGSFVVAEGGECVSVTTIPICDDSPVQGSAKLMEEVDE